MQQVICYGEVLWDVFDTGKMPGGAPMNVALHLQKQGITSQLISSVGNDANGSDLTDFLVRQDLSLDYIQVHPSLPTGVVNVALDENAQASYTIVKPVAWDEITFQENFTELASQSEAVVFGSLACRNERSHQTLLHVLEHARLAIFDMNLRPPHFQKSTIQDLMRKCDILKINEHELDYLVATLNIPSNRIEEQLKNLSEVTGIKTIATTLGDQGATVYHNGLIYKHPGFSVQVADTVGAGDAFLASFIAGFLKGNHFDDLLTTACATGAFVASKPGANPDYSAVDISRTANLI